MMKRSLFIITLSCVSSLCLAQGRVGYTYDACGNRIARTVILNAKSRGGETDGTAASVPQKDSFNGHQVTLKPVSSDGTIVIEVIGLTAADHCTASAYTTDGQQIEKVSVTGTTARISLGSQPDGLYILWIELNGDRKSWKIIKK